MSFIFLKNEDPIFTKELVTCFEKNPKSFNVTSPLEIGTNFPAKIFFDIYNKENQKVGFVYFIDDVEKESGCLEIIFGKYEFPERKVTDYILSNLAEFLKNSEQKFPITIINNINIENDHYDYLVEKAIEYGFENEFGTNPTIYRKICLNNENTDSPFVLERVLISFDQAK